MQPSSVSPPVFIPDEELSISQYMGRMVARTVVWGGGIGGVGRYVVVLCLKHLFPGSWGAIPKGGLNFSPYLFNGLLTIVVWKTIKLVYLVAMRFLGERPETIESLKTETKWDRLRKHGWEVIFCLENIHRKVDQGFSKIFRIRTLEEIKAQKIEDTDLFRLEIFRRVFIDHIQESFDLKKLPWSIGICEIVGFIPLEDRLLNVARLAFLVFANVFLGGLINKLIQFYDNLDFSDGGPAQKSASGSSLASVELQSPLNPVPVH